MVDWTSGTADASVAERDSAFIPLRVPGSPDVFKESVALDFLTKDASGIHTVPDNGNDEKLRFRGANRFLSFYNAAATVRQGYIGQFGVDQYHWNDSNGATIFGTNNVEAARFDASRNFMVGTTAQFATSRVSILGTSNGLAVRAGNANVGIYVSNTSGTANFQPMSFCNNGSSFSQIGSITCTATATAYNTSSDYRLKDSVEDLAGSGDFIDALRPRKWIWNQNGSEGAGFVAHEFAEVSPSSVTGEKDAMQHREVTDLVTGKTSIESVPVYQAMQASSAEVMAHIIAELQSLRARVAALESGQA
jgi:hypothetical protein